MSPDRHEEGLIEATLGAFRARDADGLPVAPPEWSDLSPDAMAAAFRRQLAARAVESALDERGWSGTVKAVLARIG